MEKIVKEFIEKEAMPPEGSSIIVGLSGGADSVALLHLMKSFNYRCIAAHCNFHLRGNESNRDERFCEHLSSSLGIMYRKMDFDTRAYASEKKISIEMAARELRYSWFNDLLEETGADAIAVAHHKDDNVETMLLNLIRGTGIRGLTGIKPKSGKLIRPLLCLKKDDLLSYLGREGVSYITDSSNIEDEFVRNKIRLHLLPLFESINPSVKDSISRTMDHLQQVRTVYDAVISDAIKEVWDESRRSISIPLLKSFHSPEALLYEILSKYGFGRTIVQEVFLILDEQPGKTFFSTDYRLVKDREYLFISPVMDPDNQVYEIGANDLLISEPFTLSIRYESLIGRNKIRKNKNVLYVDANKLQYPLTIRKWRFGDRFIPFGMKNYQKLSDFFINNKYSILDKENAWVLCSGENIVWIIGARADDRYKIDEKTTKTCVMQLFC